MTPHEYEILFGEPPPGDASVSKPEDDSANAVEPKATTSPENWTGLVVAFGLIAAIFLLAVIGLLTSG